MLPAGLSWAPVTPSKDGPGWDESRLLRSTLEGVSGMEGTAGLRVHLCHRGKVLGPLNAAAGFRET